MKLLSYLFPGNVRELKSVIELAVTLSDEGEIEPVDIILDSGETSSYSSEDQLTLREYELKIIKATLKKHNMDIKVAAGKLDIGVSTIYRILKDEKGWNQ
jgi:DNA-binding NtrC family response regulator